MTWRMGSRVEEKVSIQSWFWLWLVMPSIAVWKGKGFLSTPLSGIPKSISTCQNPILSLEAQLEATSYGKAVSPYRNHLSLRCHLLPWAPTFHLLSGLGCLLPWPVTLSCALVPFNWSWRLGWG